MHDGQMLFEILDTWNGQSWGIDQKIKKMVNSKKINDVIVVGISNIGAERHADYFPEKPFLSLPLKLQDSLYALNTGNHKLFNVKINSDDYLKFIVFELKPFIDRHYATLPEKENTFISGSSMGGLISMYAFFEYPEIFGEATCLSTHWIGGFTDNEKIPNTFYTYIKNRQKLIEERILYFDYGTETLDAYYEIHQRKIDTIFKDKHKAKNEYISKKFEGKDHTENSWKERFHIPLQIFLKK